MPYLFDTNIFLRLVAKNDPSRLTVLNAVRKLRAQNEVLCYTPQVLSEFWNVATRPTAARGGFGLSPSAADRKARLIERLFRLLPDSLITFQEWRRLVVAYSVTGVAVHDAKIVASMNSYGVTHLLTFNVSDFKRYPNITVVSPDNI